VGPGAGGSLVRRLPNRAVMTQPSQLPPAAVEFSPRPERAILIVVLIVLVILLAVPILVNRRVSSLRSTIEASEPARTHVTAVQFNLAREMAALSELLLTGDETSAEEYESALVVEDSIYRELEPLTQELGPEVLQRYQEVRRLSTLWHERAADAQDLLADGSEPEEQPRRRERRLFESLLAATDELDRAILRQTNETRARIEAAETLGLQLSALLGVLVLVAGAAAVVLADRSRGYARESERRRLEAERALQELARATEQRE